MRFCDITNVGELIKALEHFDEKMPVEIVSETYAHRRIDSVEANETDNYDRVVKIIPYDP